MNVANIIHASLLGIDLIVTTVLLIAWFEFERPRHALIWAGAFALLGIIWVTELLALAGFFAGSDYRVIVVLVGALASALNAVAFRQRAGRDPWWGPLIGTALVAPSILLIFGRGMSTFVSLWPLDLYNAVALGIASATLVGRRRSERTAQFLTFIGLNGLATVSALLFVVKLVAYVGGFGDRLEGFGFWLLPLLPATVTGIGICTIFLLTADLADQTRRLGATDALTGLLNRRGFEGVAQTLLDSARIGGRRVTLALIDLDHFKRVNDSFGHPVGDEVLCRFAKELASHAGRRDLLSRFGGEEFALVMVDTDMAAAVCCADTIRRAIAGIDFGLPDHRTITASFGMAETDAETPLLGDLLKRADTALYRAKEAGRNRVIAYRPEPDGSHSLV